MNFKSIVEKIKDKISNLDEIGKISLIRWGLFLLALILVIPCELLGGIALSIFAILLWAAIIAGIVLSIKVKMMKKKEKEMKASLYSNSVASETKKEVKE